jgi:hypothetical protein
MWRLYVVDFEIQYSPHFPVVDGRYASWWQPGEVSRLLYMSRVGLISTVDISSCISGQTVQSNPCQGSLFLDVRIAGTQPVISPDGTLLAYTSLPRADEDTSTFDQDIYLYRIADGGDPIRLTVDEPFDEGGFPRDWFPEWSLDGTTIYFESNRWGNLDIWAIGADGSNLMRITSDTRDESSPMVALQDASTVAGP